MTRSFDVAIVGFGPSGAVAAGLFALFPETAWALLQRQGLLDVDIPRSMAVQSIAAEVWPSGTSRSMAAFNDLSVAVSPPVEFGPGSGSTATTKV